MDDCCGQAFNRRDFLKFACALTTAASTSWSVGNAQSRQEPVLRIGYVPITDATPLLIGHSQGFFEKEGLTVGRPTLMRGQAELAEAFLAGEFNLIHLLFPLPMFMRYAQNHRVKVVAWNHINGSAITIKSKEGLYKLEDLGGKNISIPHWYSLHNIILQLCLRKFGIEPVIQERGRPLKSNQTNLVIMRPPDNAPALANGSIDGYIVAEPFNAAGEVLAHGKIARFTGDIFKNHPCCVVLMHERDIEKHPDWTQKVLNGLVNAQLWTSSHLAQVAHILSQDGQKYIPMPEAVIKRAMTKYDLQTYGADDGKGAIRHPHWGVSRIGFQPYPFPSATREIVKLLKVTRVEGDHAFLRSLDPEKVVNDLVDYRFVKAAIKKVGGLHLFESVDRAHPFERKEVIEV